MRTNNFTQNMLKKSNAALADILEDKETYTDEAIQAVIWELENRDIIEKGSIIHNPVLLEKDILVEEKEIEDIPAASIEELAIPTLYSKRAIQGFTIFFSTLFGAVLLMSNLKKLNKPRARMEVFVFGIGYTFLTILLLNYLPKTFFLTMVFNLIGYAVLVEYYWNKNLGKELKYQKKQISKPLIISFTILIFLVFLQFLPSMLGS
mgnify:CR=1 FL=1|jgi:hypothetical protein